MSHQFSFLELQVKNKNGLSDDDKQTDSRASSRGCLWSKHRPTFKCVSVCSLLLLPDAAAGVFLFLFFFLEGGGAEVC